MKPIILVLLGGLALLAACSSTSSDHNAQDVSFAQDMVPHHTQAVQMADMALAQGSSTKVKDLATRIKAAQGPEIARMKGWLTTWGEPLAATSGDTDHAGGMSMGSGGGAGMNMGTGMMSEAQMNQLRGATGADFDRMFLTMMVEHHQGAVAMSRTELDKGRYGPAKQLAQAITDAQQKEIAEMQGLLGSL